METYNARFVIFPVSSASQFFEMVEQIIFLSLVGSLNFLQRLQFGSRAVSRGSQFVSQPAS
jgi:hypothetical protein